MNTLSDKIESCYKSMGITRIDFAQKIGVPESTIRNWHRFGSVPAADVLYKVSKFFNVPMEYFLDGSENPLSDKEIATIIKLRKLNSEQLKMIDYMIEKFVKDNSQDKPESSTN